MLLPDRFGDAGAAHNLLVVKQRRPSELFVFWEMSRAVARLIPRSFDSSRYAGSAQDNGLNSRQTSAGYSLRRHRSSALRRFAHAYRGRIFGTRLARRPRTRQRPGARWLSGCGVSIRGRPKRRNPHHATHSILQCDHLLMIALCAGTQSHFPSACFTHVSVQRRRTCWVPLSTLSTMVRVPWMTAVKHSSSIK